MEKKEVQTKNKRNKQRKTKKLRKRNLKNQNPYQKLLVMMMKFKNQKTSN